MSREQPLDLAAENQIGPASRFEECRPGIGGVVFDRVEIDRARILDGDVG
ncbi:MAG: hypothetical protein WD872_11845 [Pirellulaceae bacterium]